MWFPFLNKLTAVFLLSCDEVLPFLKALGNFVLPLSWNGILCVLTLISCSNVFSGEWISQYAFKYMNYQSSFLIFLFLKKCKALLKAVLNLCSSPTSTLCFVEFFLSFQVLQVQHDPLVLLEVNIFYCWCITQIADDFCKYDKYLPLSIMFF